jgi:hypothetical protein
MEVDNSEDLRTAAPEIRDAKEQEFTQLFKNVQKFITKPPKNDMSKDWIANELNKKDALPVPKRGSEVGPHEDSKSAEQARELGLDYYGFGRYGKNGKVTHRSVHDKLVDVTKIKPPKEPTSLTKESVSQMNENYNLSDAGAMNLLLLGKTFEIIDTFADFVRPERHPVLSDFCRGLTHIEQDQVASAAPFAAVWPRFAAWIGGPLEAVTFASWGAYDFAQLRRQVRALGAPPPAWRPLNIKAAFADCGTPS